MINLSYYLLSLSITNLGHEEKKLILVCQRRIEMLETRVVMISLWGCGMGCVDLDREKAVCQH